MFRLLQRDSMGKITIEDLRNKMSALVDKMGSAKTRA